MRASTWSSTSSLLSFTKPIAGTRCAVSASSMRRFNSTTSPRSSVPRPAIGRSSMVIARVRPCGASAAPAELVVSATTTGATMNPATSARQQTVIAMPGASSFARRRLRPAGVFMPRIIARPGANRTGDRLETFGPLAGEAPAAPHPAL